MSNCCVVCVVFIKGFTGKDCDKAIVPCKENPCQNGAVCLLEDDRPVCYCVPDYHGVLCELKYDDCESKFAQCDNGGTCIDGINSFTCSCPSNYGGPMCEYSFSSTTTLEMEDIERGTSLIRTTTAIVSSKETTSLVNTSVYLPSTSTISFATYSTSPRTSSSSYTKKYTIMEKTTTSRYEGEDSSISSESTVFLTEVPSTSSTRDDLVTPEAVTMSSSAVTEGYFHEIESTEVYLPTGRSIHDDEVTKEPSDYNQTTKIHPPIFSRVDEDVTEYTASSR